MQTKPFGSTGLSVSPIGIGLAALGRPGYITIGHADALGRNYDVTAMEAGAHRVLDKAYAMGVRYFDAARSYGRAEAFLASWLKRRGYRRGMWSWAPSGATPTRPDGRWRPRPTR
jgi:aryl-alcohol dehydrogenase-like predicted oxidoreductase